jgi:glycosyltransferase involved in cell wall biosynthesis
MAPAGRAVSVVIPVHNRFHLVPLTLSSVLWQRDVEVEVIVVDDGSAGDLRESLAEIRDPRVRFVRQDPARGVSVARNRGFTEARHPWIGFLDSDDLWAPDKLISQLRAAEQASRCWVYAGAVEVTADLRVVAGQHLPVPDDVVAAAARVNPVPGGCSNVLVHRALLPAPPFDPSLRYCADWELWIRLSRLGSPAAVDRPLVGYRIHGDSMSLDTEGMFAELDVLDRRYGGPVDRATFYSYVARVLLRAGRHRKALRYCLRASAIDSRYRRRGFFPDLLAVAQGLSRKIWHRLTCALSVAPSETLGASTVLPAAERPWVEQAQTWVDELVMHREAALFDRSGHAIRSPQT